MSLHHDRCKWPSVSQVTASQLVDKWVEPYQNHSKDGSMPRMGDNQNALPVCSVHINSVVFREL